MDAREFAEWLGGDSPWTVYHTGYLAKNRTRLQWLGAEHGYIHLPVAPVDEVALAAWKAYEVGKVHLAQRKLGKGCYQYLAYRA